MLRAAEVARRCNVTTRTVRNWAAEGKIAAVRLPTGQVRVREDVVDALLRAEPAGARGGRS